MAKRNDTITNKNGKNGKQFPSTYGPVQNLEDHLQPDWWRRIFNSMYLKTDADVVEDQKITAFELDIFDNILGLSKEMAFE